MWARDCAFYKWKRRRGMVTKSKKSSQPLHPSLFHLICMWNWKHARQQFDILHSSWMAHNWGTLYIFLHSIHIVEDRIARHRLQQSRRELGQLWESVTQKKSEREHKKSLWMSEKLTKMLLLWRWNSLTMKKKRELFIVRRKKKSL